MQISSLQGACTPPRVCGSSRTSPACHAPCVHSSSLPTPRCRGVSAISSSSSSASTSAPVHAVSGPSLAAARRSPQGRWRRTVCHSTLDDPELAELVSRMHEQRLPESGPRERLDKCLKLIDEANSGDPSKVRTEAGGPPRPYRVVYAEELSRWVQRLDPQAPDELLILARGQNVQSWELSKIKRDDYSPTWAGMRQWENDRKAWQANRLTSIMKEAGYEEVSVKTVEDVLLSKDIPDPRNMRKHDLLGPFGLINFRLLRFAEMLQTLKDAEALLFLEKNFAAMQGSMPPDEVQSMLERELSRVSQRCMIEALAMDWTAVQRKLLLKAFRSPTRYPEIMKNMEGVAAGSLHPGDWRFKNFDYE